MTAFLSKDAPYFFFTFLSLPVYFSFSASYLFYIHILFFLFTVTAFTIQAFLATAFTTASIRVLVPSATPAVFVTKPSLIVAAVPVKLDLIVVALSDILKSTL